ncbi:DOMON domain, Cytochrome b561/ferric reductase transmembrane, DM13 domain protein [Heracleum sosnowskyi]|uniref:DOMON domain, Cytochrome b561/ferric reductase transmembrane, DM13 domain protein n=1 Tax=Heracleum sosnowskyi TaxID=360622 RepID=A0AAD8J143_9APIA|nr:DOMON domain, Cytochrome b561/ferric reductase transmembrane, DM13 domain protein [Heracleum sosnowskyi]
MHSITSSRPVRVLLVSGSAEAEEDLRPVLSVHGFMMFLAWGILLPGGILSARYLKHLKGDGWFKIHVYMQYSGLAIIFLGFLFAVAELRGLYLDSIHVKFGMGAIILACVQPVNAYLRPKKSASGEIVSSNRIMWEYIHVIVGRCSIVVGMAALFSGMKHLGERYDVYLEYREKQRRRENFLARSNWVLGNGEEEDHDLLSPSGMSVDKDLHPSDRMEVQLEPLNR